MKKLDTNSSGATVFKLSFLLSDKKSPNKLYSQNFPEDPDSLKKWENYEGELTGKAYYFCSFCSTAVNNKTMLH